LVALWATKGYGLRDRGRIGDGRRTGASFLPPSVSFSTDPRVSRDAGSVALAELWALWRPQLSEERSGARSQK